MSIHGRSADTNLADIHEEMSELLDKQVNVQNESLKKTFGVHATSRKPMKEVCDENERKKQQQRKNFVVKGRTLYGCIRRMAELILINFRISILLTMKVLIL